MNTDTEILIETTRLANTKTNHVLHLILSILTAGLWVFIWMLAALSNSLERHRLERKLRKLSGKS